MTTPPDSDLPQRWSLRTLLVALLLATLIPLLLLIGAWFGWATCQERARAERDAREEAELIAAETGRVVAETQGMLIVLGRAQLVTTRERAATTRLLQDLLARASHLEDIAVILPDGTLAASAAAPSSGLPA